MKQPPGEDHRHAHDDRWQVEVLSPDRHEAAALANPVALAYTDRRQQLANERR